MPDRLISHATRKEQLTEVGLDATGIARSVRDAIRTAATERQGQPDYV
jgi:deoxyxylulose-5-phosphate synthase